MTTRSRRWRRRSLPGLRTAELPRACSRSGRSPGSVLWVGLDVTNLSNRLLGPVYHVDPRIRVGAGAFSLSPSSYFPRQELQPIGAWRSSSASSVHSAMLALEMDMVAGSLQAPDGLLERPSCCGSHHVVIFYSMVLVFELAPAVLEASRRARFPRGPHRALLHAHASCRSSAGAVAADHSSLGAIRRAGGAPAVDQASCRDVYPLGGRGGQPSPWPTVSTENVMDAARFRQLRGHIAMFAG